LFRRPTFVEPQRSETATLDAVAREKPITSADRIAVEQWEDNRWDGWLRRSVHTESNWHAE
jgi:hypothetical protein